MSRIRMRQIGGTIVNLTGEYVIDKRGFVGFVSILNNIRCTWILFMHEPQNWLIIDEVMYVPKENETREDFLNRIGVPLHNAMVEQTLMNLE